MTFLILKSGLVILFGLAFTFVVNFKDGWLERFGLAFLAGTGILSVIYFVFIWLTNRVVATDFWLITGVLTVIMIILKRPKIYIGKIKNLKLFNKPNIVSLVCWSAILILFASSLINAFYRPVYTTDSLILFDFRARVMFMSHMLSPIRTINGWQNYPMFTSMIGLISRFIGIDNPSFYYPLMYLSFSVIFYSILRKTIGNNLASVGTLLMYTTPITLWQSQLDGMTNIPYTIFLCLSIFYIYKILNSRRINLSDAVISALFLGFSTWTRATEPLWVVPIFLVAALAFTKRKFIFALVYLVTFYPIWKLWPSYEGWQYSSIGTAGKILIKSAFENNSNKSIFCERFMHVFNSMFTFIVADIGWVFLIFLIVVFCDVVFFKSVKNQVFYIFTVIVLLAIIFLGSLFMTINYGFEVNVYNGSLSRLLSIFPPLMWFCITISPAWTFVIKSLKLRGWFR